VVHDITSRKKMEEKLRENEQKYRFLTENSGEVIWHINKSNRIDYISSADEKIRGYKREEVLGTQIWSIFKPEGIQLVREKMEHHREVEQVGNNMNVTRFEIEQRCKDGSWIWTEIVASPHYDKFGDLIGYHGISRDTTERKQLMDQLYLQAITDYLTQIPNRRHFMNLAEIELRRAKRYHHPLSIVVIDFNGLKRINDTFGHLAGDRALSVFAKIVLQIIRDIDVMGRFGGDEFLLLLPETDLEHAYLVMDRIQEILASSPIFYGKKSFTLSISSGIASIDNWTDTLEDLLDRADKALYESRNRR
jgi:diguanylate cyclase (GGDEF)-like protein/PAS domain S-box-containing protein